MEDDNRIDRKAEELLERLLGTFVEPGLVYEGLIYSASQRDLIDTLNKCCPQSASPSEGCVKIEFAKLSPPKADSYGSLIRSLGYYMAAWVDANGMSHKDQEDAVTVVKQQAGQSGYGLLDAQFDVSLFVPERYLYHALPARKLKKVLDLGLRPSSGSKLGYHPVRVYFCTSLPAAESLAWKLAQKAPRDFRTDKLQDFAIVRFDNHNMETSLSFDDPPPVKFFKDPHFSSGVYTTTYIGPSRLEVVKTLKWGDGR